MILLLIGIGLISGTIAILLIRKNRVKENAERKVEYAERKELTERIVEKYCPDLKSEETGKPKPSGRVVGQTQAGARRTISPDGRRTDRPFLRTYVKRQLPFNQIRIAEGEKNDGQA